MTMERGIIFDIKRFAVHDGPGIRTTVFFKGCPMRCPWCHNPESWIKEPQTMEGKDQVGYETNIDNIMKEIEKEVIFYDESGGGVTFSGGEPLLQPEFLAGLLDRCHKHSIHTTIDTSGFTSASVFQGLVEKTSADLFLFDLKIMDDKEHQRITGVSNQPILANLQTLCEKQCRTIIRFPVIPGFTDTNENIEALGHHLRSLNQQNPKTLKSIHLLPYHRIATGKFRRLGIKNELENRGTQPPSQKQLETIKQKLTALTSLSVSIY